MSAFAGTVDIEAAWRTLTDTEVVVAGSRLTFISAIIRTKVPDVDTRIAAGTLDATLVKHVAVAAVLRTLKNPDGKSEEQIEDYRYRRDASSASGALYLTGDELALLTRRARGAFSITPAQEPATCAIAERVAVLQDQWTNWTPTGDGTDER